MADGGFAQGRCKMNRIEEFPLFMDVLMKGRVYWSNWSPKGSIKFVVPGQVSPRSMTLDELLQYLKNRYKVSVSNPQVGQVVERFDAEVARQQAEYEAE